MKPENHPLDDLIRQRIADLPPAPARGWEGLARRLEEGQAADAALADKLAALPAAAPPAGSWSAFERKLTAAEAETAAAVDSAVSEALQRARPAAVSGWADLAARLEVIGQRREMVACLKISEAALLLSLLLIALRLGEAPVAGPPLAAASEQSPFPIAAAAAAAPGPTTTRDVSAPPVRDTHRPPAADRISGRVVPALPATDIAPLPGTPTAPALRRPTHVTEGLPTLAYGVDVRPRRISAPLHFPGLLNGAPVRYYLNAFVSPVDLNSIVTQDNEGLGIEAQRRLSTGYSVGTLVDVTQGPNGLQFGLVYGRRSYVPAKILLLEEDSTGVTREQDIRYSRLIYSTVSLPLSYQRELHATDKWRVSAGVGMAMNVVLGAQVKLPEDVTLEDLNRLIEEAIPDIKSPRGKAQARRIIEPTSGFLQGGGLLENSSLYLTGSLRVERLLGDRWSLYVSPTVTRLLTVRERDGGKGPLEDRIHNTMLQFGARLRLTDK